jgi:uncharacterized protein (DUF1015 family)
VASVRPLRLRIVQQSWAERVSSPAHDALTPEDRRAHLAFNPDSYMAVTRGLEDIDPREGVDAEGLLHRGREALDRLRQNGAFSSERGDEFYVYRLAEQGRTLTGLIAGVSVADYIAGRVRIHEHVKATRAIHLANHLDVVGVQSSPIALAHLPNAIISRAIERAVGTDPIVQFALPDGLEQTVWPVTDGADHEALLTVLDNDPLYLIDGHHRAAAAATFRTAAGPGMADWMLCAIFATNELDNAPHHRVIRAPGGVAETLRVIGRRHRLRRSSREEIDQRSSSEIALYGDGRWYCLDLPMAGEPGAEGQLADLDPSRFQSAVVGPLLHLDPEGDDPALSYLAGRRDPAELEAVMNREGGLLAVMRHVPIEVLVTAADTGLIMPPKSTYFEPKVRSGVFIRATTG